MRQEGLYLLGDPSLGAAPAFDWPGEGAWTGGTAAGPPVDEDPGAWLFAA
jgi:hypothetical protein